MNFDLSALPPLPLPMPSVPDMGHVGLGALALLLFILLLFKGRRSKNASTAGTELDPSQKQPAQLIQTTPDAALQVLTLLQQGGRFIDFLHEDLSAYSDADVGAAARVVHDGSKKVIADYFTLAPVRSEQEETQISLPAGFDAAETRLTGNVVGEPPFRGTLVHRGWKVLDVKLPKLAAGHDANIIAPAEVEL
jgi:hypothetical protein